MVKSTIYKICCKDSAVKDCYVGRTIDVTSRFQTHKACCYNTNIKAYNYKLYKTIRENGGLENWSLEEIETIEHNADDTTPARERENYWFVEYCATLNNNIPNQSHTASCKKWQENNKDYYKNYDKQYREKNKEQIKIKSKEYYDKNKEKLMAYNKIWINKDENREKNRTYQRERLQKIKLKKLENASFIDEGI